MDIIKELESKGYSVKSNLFARTFNLYDSENSLVALNVNYEDLKDLKVLCDENIGTREWAIKQHRKMWKWISRQIMKDYREKYSIKTICRYKRIYLKNNFKKVIIDNSCFCCKYSHSKSIIQRCTNNCPLYWNDENTETSCIEGYYGSLNKILNSIIIGSVNKDSIEEYLVGEEEAKRLSRMAYKIAMLEERKDNV